MDDTLLAPLAYLPATVPVQLGELAGTSVSAEEWLRKPGTVGRPSPGVQIKILDDDGDECPAGSPGPVCARIVR